MGALVAATAGIVFGGVVGFMVGKKHGQKLFVAGLAMAQEATASKGFSTINY